MLLRWWCLLLLQCLQHSRRLDGWSNLYSWRQGRVRVDSVINHWILKPCVTRISSFPPIWIRPFRLASIRYEDLWKPVFLAQLNEQANSPYLRSYLLSYLLSFPFPLVLFRSQQCGHFRDVKFRKNPPLLHYCPNAEGLSFLPFCSYHPLRLDFHPAGWSSTRRSRQVDLSLDLKCERAGSALHRWIQDLETAQNRKLDPFQPSPHRCCFRRQQRG
mmetsp:Transcript_27527/g.50828  ORF Transcript_27527/g.50828 Transcript_27527/m.50828 type:complete len:216 (-) Transcript_27527:351-998(-)